MTSYFRRHVFQPLMGRGWPYNFAAIVVFTISAFLHELAVGIPTHNIIGQSKTTTLVFPASFFVFYCLIQSFGC